MATQTLEALASEDWALVEEGTRAASLVVQLRRSIHVLPWFRFAYASGDGSKVELDFGEHTVTVIGRRLDVLLAAVAEHRVAVLLQPTENQAKFDVRGQPSVKQTGRPVIERILIDDDDQVEAYQ